MEVTETMIRKLAHLSRLRFDDVAMQEIKNDLMKMVAMVDKMNEVDTEGIAPLLHMSAAQNITRPDVAGGQLSVTEALQNANASNGEFFTVPKVIAK